MSQPADQPRARAIIRPDGSTEVALDGVAQTLYAPSVEEARANLVGYLAYRAQPLGRPIWVDVDDPDGAVHLVVNPDGSIGEQPQPAGSSAVPPVAAADEHVRDTIPPHELPALREEAADVAMWGPRDAEDRTVRSSRAAPSAAPPSQPVPPPQPAVVAQPAPPVHVAEVRPREPEPASAPVVPATVVPSPWPDQQEPPGWVGEAPAGGPPSTGEPWNAVPPDQPQVAEWMRGQHAAAAAAPVTRRQMRESFLRTEQTEAPASHGMRGALTRMGIKTQPSAAERSEREDAHAVSQHWPGVRTIAVVNGKGGAGKSPTTALLAATFARYSGAATIAWDNNETRGTLGWRTEQGKHENTVLDLIPRAPELMDPAARAGDISHYVHHQAADKYDVLRSNPNLLSAEQRITAANVDAIHDVLGRYYRLVFIDSGNDESAEHWLRMIDKADQLVVPTIAKAEHAEAGALLLEALVQRGGRSAQLAQRAVVIVSQAREKDANPSAADIAGGFSAWVSAVETIPYDAAMVENVLRFDALAPATRRAWLRAAAAVARQL